MLPPRRHDVSRLEAFSDAAFAFALTLLVVSLNVPRSYDELMRLLQGSLSFACCFALLVWIWHEHNLFFRRYGLQDGLTVFLNGVLLFVVLFYVYPLKFMFDSMFAQMIPGAHPDLTRMTLPQLSRASSVYALGFVVLFVMFALLYGHAYRRREQLGLTPMEMFDAKSYAGHHLVSAGVGVISLLVAVFAPLRFAPLSPMCFALMGPAHWYFGNQVERRRPAFVET
jgi:uncharacterized membrane protein